MKFAAKKSFFMFFGFMCLSAFAHADCSYLSQKPGGCDAFEYMLADPVETYCSWKKVTCRQKINDYIINNQISVETIENVFLLLTDEWRQKVGFSDIEKERLLRSASGANGKLTATGTIDLSQEDCVRVFGILQQPACSQDTVNALFENGQDERWLSFSCMKAVFQAISGGRSYQESVAEGVNRLDVSFCCKKYKEACPSASRDLYVQNKSALIKELLKRNNIYTEYRTVLADGNIYMGALPDGETRGIELPEVVVVSPIENNNNLAERYRPEIQEQLHLRGITRPGFARHMPVTGGTDETENANQVLTQKQFLTQEQCLEWHNISSGICEDVGSLLLSGYSGWLKPACVQEMSDLLRDNVQYAQHVENFGRELVVLGRMSLAQTWFDNYSLCEKYNLFSSDLKSSMQTFFPLLKTKIQPYQNECRQLASLSRQSSCPQDVSSLLDNNPSGLENWQNPECIRQLAQTLKEYPDWQTFKGKVKDMSFFARQIQQALFLPDVYHACGWAFKSLDADALAIREAANLLVATLQEKGIRVKYDILPQNFLNDGYGDGATVSPNAADGIEKSGNSLDEENGLQQGSNRKPGAAGRGLGVSPEERDGTPTSNWNERGGGLFRLRFLEPNKVGFVDTVPEETPKL